MSSVEITGGGISLRDWRLEDLDKYLLWISPGHEWQELDGPYYPKPDEDGAREIVARKREDLLNSEPPELRETLVISSGDTGEMLGVVSRYWESRETLWLSVGIVIFDPASWGKGIGFEALGLWSSYLFDEMPELARLDLRTWSGNAGMMRLAEKLGYQQEACFRKARIVEGRFYDGMGYGVLREEWESMYPEGFVAHLRN